MLLNGPLPLLHKTTVFVALELQLTHLVLAPTTKLQLLLPVANQLDQAP